MGKVYSYFSRPLRTFNIENRTERILAKSKPTPAPQYPYVKKQKEVVDKLYPNFMETHLKKDTQLDDRLKQVFVESDNQKVEVSPSTKSLPQDRSQTPLFEYGVYVSDVIPEGKCSLRQALDFISKHNENPTEYSAKQIAQEYKLDEQVVENILKHFKIPNVKQFKRRQIDWTPVEKTN